MSVHIASENHISVFDCRTDPCFYYFIEAFNLCAIE